MELLHKYNLHVRTQLDIGKSRNNVQADKVQQIHCIHVPQPTLCAENSGNKAAIKKKNK